MNLPNNPTPDISQSDTYIVANTVPITNLINGQPDDIRYFIFSTSSTIESNSNIKLQGDTDFTATVGDTLTLIYDGTEWLELSRSLNPIYTGGSLNQYYLDGGYLAQEIETLKNSVSVLQNQMALMGVVLSDNLITLSPGMTSFDIQNRIDNINKNIVNNAVISIVFESGLYNITDSLLFTNFSGDGQIKIYADNFTSGLSHSKTVLLDGTTNSNSLFKFTNCDVNINIEELHCKSTLINNGSYKGLIEIYNSSNLTVDSIYTENSSMYNSGVYFENSRGYVNNTYVTKGKYGICANRMSNVGITNCDDYDEPSYGISSMNGSNVFLLDSQQPRGIESDTFMSVASSINA